MKALVYLGPGEKAWTDVPSPKLQRPTDVIVRIDTTTICGSDLHILKGDVPAVVKGRILGHEGVGVVTEVGSSITRLAVGDNVIVSCIKSCGRFPYAALGIGSGKHSGNRAAGYKGFELVPVERIRLTQTREEDGRVGAGRPQLGVKIVCHVLDRFPVGWRIDQ